MRNKNWKLSVVVGLVLGSVVSGQPGFQSSSGAPPTRSVTKTVAAYNSANKTGADYLCDGTNDEVQLQAAIDSLPAYLTTGRYNGGVVLLREGQYNIGKQILMRPNCRLQGAGWYTTTLKAQTDSTTHYPVEAAGVLTVTVAVGGSGYAVGDVLIISGGNGAAVCKADTIYLDATVSGDGVSWAALVAN